MSMDTSYDNDASRTFKHLSSGCSGTYRFLGMIVESHSISSFQLTSNSLLFVEYCGFAA